MGAAALLSLALAGCGSSGTSGLLNGSALDLFSTSSKATANTPGGAQAAAADTDIDCPEVQVRTGAATFTITGTPKQGEPSPLDVRYQGTIIRTARECHVNAGVMTMKVGVEGRIITGPAAGPGNVDVPLRIAVVKEGVNPQTILSKFGRETVTLANAVDRATFTHIDSDITFPLPQPLADIDAYVIYVGFDPLGAQQDKKKPPVKRKSPAKPKTAAAR